jgi:hypothetical protein
VTWASKKWTYGENQFFTVKEYNDTSGYIPKNVSGYTITLKVEKGSTLLVSGTCIIASATTGYIYYTMGSGDFPYTGTANYELELVMSGVKTFTETHQLHVGNVI